MNLYQKLIAGAFIAVLLGMLLCPPWQARFDLEGPMPKGYDPDIPLGRAPFFSPPEPLSRHEVSGAHEAYMDLQDHRRYGNTHRERLAHPEIDWARQRRQLLLTLCLGVAFVAFYALRPMFRPRH